MTEMLIKSADDVQHQNGARWQKIPVCTLLVRLVLGVKGNVTEVSCSDWQHRAAMTDAAFY